MLSFQNPASSPAPCERHGGQPVRQPLRSAERFDQRSRIILSERPRHCMRENNGQQNRALTYPEARTTKSQQSKRRPQFPAKMNREARSHLLDQDRRTQGKTCRETSQSSRKGEARPQHMRSDPMEELAESRASSVGQRRVDTIS